MLTSAFSCSLTEIWRCDQVFHSCLEMWAQKAMPGWKRNALGSGEDEFYVCPHLFPLSRVECVENAPVLLGPGQEWGAVGTICVVVDNK